MIDDIDFTAEHRKADIYQSFPGVNGMGSRLMNCKWWNREVKEQAKIEGKTVKQYHVTAWGEYIEDGEQE